MIIAFLPYLEKKQAEQAAVIAAEQAEIARRTRLENVLTDLLAELEAA